MIGAVSQSTHQRNLMNIKAKEEEKNQEKKIN